MLIAEKCVLLSNHMGLELVPSIKKKNSFNFGRALIFMIH